MTLRYRCAPSVVSQPDGSRIPPIARKQARQPARPQIERGVELLQHGTTKRSSPFGSAHETVETPLVCIRADLRTKENAPAHLTAPEIGPPEHPADKLSPSLSGSD